MALDQGLKAFADSELGIEPESLPEDTDDGPARALARDLMSAMKADDLDGVTDAILAIWASAHETKDALTDKE